MYRSLTFFLFALTVGVACEPDPSTLDSTSDCSCFERPEDGSARSVCPADFVCPGLDIRCDPSESQCPISGQDSGEGWTVGDEVALECILTGLRDGAPGKYTWSVTSIAEAGWHTEDTDVYVTDGKLAFHSHWNTLDLSGTQDPVTLNELATTEFFQECLDATDLAKRVSCLFEPVAAEVEFCIDGGDINYI